MTMCEPSQQTFWQETELPLTLLRAGSRAKTFQRQVSDVAYLREHGAGFTARLSDSLATYDQNSSSWKTSQTCLLAQLSIRADGLAEFSETWPRSGMMRSGIAYRLPTLAHCTNATESGSSLIPTPTACDYKGSGRPRKERGPKNNLRDWFKWHFNMQYPPVAAVEYMMGFPTGHTDLKP